MTSATPFLPGLSPVAGKSLTAERDAGNLTSNGGLIALREIERRLDIAGMIAKHIPDRRNPLLITHTYADMNRARMMMIAAGYEDCVMLQACSPSARHRYAEDRPGIQDRLRSGARNGRRPDEPADALTAGEHAGCDGLVQDRPRFHRRVLRGLQDAAGVDRARHRHAESVLAFGKTPTIWHTASRSSCCSTRMPAATARSRC